jgi:hypothetical protein
MFVCCLTKTISGGICLIPTFSSDSALNNGKECINPTLLPYD